MRHRARRLLVCLLSLGICAAALSAFRVGLEYRKFVLPPHIANREPDTKVTLCTQVRGTCCSSCLYCLSDPLVSIHDAWMRPFVMLHMLRAGPQRHAVPGKLGSSS